MGESLVNTTTAGSQAAPTIATNDAGAFLVTWQMRDNADGADGIFAQRYDATGQRLGGEFRVNTGTVGQQDSAAAAMAADGSFVVVWRSEALGGAPIGTFAQRFGADGTALGPEILVTTEAFGTSPSVAIARDGRFVVAWQDARLDGSDWGIAARRYGADGVPEGAQFRVNSTGAGRQTSPAVAMDAEGNVAILWEGVAPAGAGEAILGQRYDAAGAPQGGEFRASGAPGLESSPAVAMDEDGNFVVAWVTSSKDLAGTGIMAQRFDATGTAVGNEFRVNGTAAGNQRDPVIAMTASGAFTIAWENRDQDGDGIGIFAQRYNAAGAPLGGEIQANLTTAENQFDPAIGMDAAGNVRIAWVSDGQDGSGYGVYLRSLPAPSPMPGAITLDLDAFAPGLDSDSAVTLGAAPRRVLGEKVSILAAAHGTLTGATIAFGPRQDGAAETLALAPEALAAAAAAGIAASWDGPAGVLTLSGVATLEAYAAALEGLRYGNAALRPTSSVNGLAVQLFDGEVASNVATATLLVGPAPDLLGNAVTAGSQMFPAVAIDASGRILLAGQDGPGGAGFAQFLAAGGVASGVPIGFGGPLQRDVDVALDPSGGFVATWSAFDAADNAYDVMAARFAPDGTPSGAAFRVSQTKPGSQAEGAVGMDAAGNFVVAWGGAGASGTGLYLRRYDAAGNALGDETLVAAGFDPLVGGQDVALAMNQAGELVISWSATGPGFAADILLRRYGADGVALGEAFSVDPLDAASQGSPAVAIDNAGDVIVAWRSDADNMIRAQRLDAAGTPLGAVMIAGRGEQVAVAMDADGDFALAWTDYTGSGSADLLLGRYLADGTPMAPAARVNARLAGLKRDLDLAMDGAGNLVLAWTGQGAAPAADDDIFFRVFAADGTLAPQLDLDAAASGTGFAATFVPGGVALAAADAVLAGAPTQSLAALTATLAGGAPRGAESLALDPDLPLPAGVTASWDAAAGQLTIAGSASRADYQALLRGLRYDSTDPNPAPGERHVDIRVGEGTAWTETATAAIRFVGGPPTAPGTPVLDAASDSGVAGDGITNDDTPTLGGQAAPGSLVQLWAGVALVGEAEADATGAWMATIATLAEGAHALTATATDAAGQVSAASDPLALVVDTTPPAKPRFDRVVGDTGNAKDLVTADGTLLFQGRAAAGSSVTVLLDGVAIGTARANATGSWRLDHTDTLLADGRYMVVAQVVDAAGNLAESAARLLVVDSVAAPPLVTGIQADTGSSGQDGVTREPALIFSGTAEPLSQLDLFLDASHIATLRTSANGSWRHDHRASPLAEGSHALVARITDVAGNVSEPSTPFMLVVDTTAPDAPIMGGSLAGSLLTLHGVVEAGAEILVTRGGLDWGQASADADGAWSLTRNGVRLTDAAGFDFAARILDRAGNVSEPGALTALSVAPAPGATLRADGSLIGPGIALTMTGSDGADFAGGGAGDDSILGGAGRDRLSDGGGGDTLAGGAGDDLYLLRSLSTLVIEAAGEGIDTIQTDLDFFSLAPHADVENLTYGGAGDAWLMGGHGNNSITGGAGADTLEGGAGRDRLLGGGGRDIFRFTAADEFGDRINDFARNQDRLEIASAALGGRLPEGQLGAANFASGAASAASPQFIYTRATGALAFDSDGTGEAGAFLVALIANKISLGATDIIIG